MIITRYAQFHDEPGYAVRTSDQRVFFLDHDAQSVLLTTTDIPALTRPAGRNLQRRSTDDGKL